MAKKKKKRLKLRLFVLTVLSFLVSVVPLLSVFIKNFDKYVSCAEDVMKLSIGALVIMIIMLLKVIGKLKLPPRLVTATVMLVMCWLFAKLLEDLLIISLAWWVSELVDFIIFTPLIRRTREAILVQKTAAASAEATVEAVKSYLGRV